MPLYLYVCKCGEQFEAIKSIASRHDAICKCGKTAKLKISAWGRVIFSSFFRVVGSDGRILQSKQITERTPYTDSNGREW